MRDQASFAKRAEDLFEGAMMLAARLPRILSALEARQEPTPVPVKSSLPFVTTLVVLAVAFAAFFT